MRNPLFFTIFFFGFVAFSFAQGPAGHWKLGGNGSPPPAIDGVNATNNILGTIPSLPIRFITDNNERMRLTEVGLLGLNTTTPQAMFHIDGNFGQTGSIGEMFRTNTRSTVSTYWRMFRGNNEKGAIYNDRFDNNFRIQAMQNNATLAFHISHIQPGFGLITNKDETEVMSLRKVLRNTGTGTNGFQMPNVTRAAVSALSTMPITDPLSLLHIGFNNNGNSGWRNWMDVGLYANAQSDNMYVGMKDEAPGIGWSDYQSAVISWADNTVGSTKNRLRFIFTSNVGLAAAHDGLEIARMISDGNNGRMGVGNFFTPLGSPTIDPLNTMEIRSNTAFGDTRSGLRFTNLTATMPVDFASNSSKTVLSVNDMGDVVLVNDDGGIQGCNNVLVADAGIQLNGNNFYFQGQDTEFDKVGIGVSCGGLLGARFQVENILTPNDPHSRLTSFFHNSGNDPSNAAFTFAVAGVSDATGGIANVGGFFQGTGSNNSFFSYGLNARAIGATRNFAVVGSVATISGGNPNDVAGQFNGNLNYTGAINGVSDKNLKENITSLSESLKLLSQLKPSKFKFKTTPYLALPTGMQYGFIAQELENVFPELVSDITIAETIDALGNIISPSQTYRGVNYLGLLPITIQAVKDLDFIVSKATLSDVQLKQNVQPLTNALSLVNQLNAVSYEWNQTVDTTLILPLGTEVGLIAQDVNTVMPEVTYIDDKGYMHVEYQKIVPYLIEANKALKAEKDNLQSQLDALAQQVASIQNCMDNLPIGAGCNQASVRTITPSNNNATFEKEAQRVVLETTDMAILYQNEPNPFTNNTTIRYYIPENTQEAILVFYDEFGREMNKEILTSKGYASVQVDAEKLAAGIYTYSLIVDGKLLATKKMIKVRN